MHELAITEQIADIAIRHGQENQAEKITDLYLVIGELSTVV
ncbi:MAG: hydrogenase/urease maturation nickel metallochaperone HypA, partial [Anaerolineales bacterium]